MHISQRLLRCEPLVITTIRGRAGRQAFASHNASDFAATAHSSHSSMQRRASSSGEKGTVTEDAKDGPTQRRRKVRANRKDSRGHRAWVLALLVLAATFTSPLSAWATDPPTAGSISTSASTVAPPQTFRLTGTASSDVSQVGYPYWITIYDVTAGAHNALKTCTTGTSCSVDVQAAWHWNDDLTQRRYRVEVGPSASSSIAVDVTHTAFDPRISASPNSVQAGDSIQLNGTTAVPIDGSPYQMRVVELGTYTTTRKACTTGSTCDTSDTAALTLNDDPQPKSYKLVVGRSDNSGYVWESPPVSVDVRRTDFNPILIAGSYNVSVGQSVELTGTIAKDNTGYWMRIIDLDRGARKVCTTGTSCTVSDLIGWDAEENPQPRHYKMTVGRSDGRGYVFESPTITVNVMPIRFGVDISANSTTDAAGNKIWTVTATSDRAVGPAGYYLQIRNANGNVIANCTSGTSCQASNVAAGRYKAYVVKPGSGRVFGESFWIDLSNAGAVVLGNGYSDFVRAQSHWDSVEQFCIDVAAYGDHISGASVSDQWIQACSSGTYPTVDLAMLGLLRTEGGPRVLATVIILAGAVTATAWNNAHTALGPEPDPSATPTPTATPPTSGPTSPVAPTDANGILVEDLEQNLIDRNGYSLDQQLQSAHSSLTVRQVVHTVARECLDRTALAGEPSTLCRSLPVFASGADVEQATAWDMTALGDRLIPNIKPHPEWALLDYTTNTSYSGWTSVYPETEAYGYAGFATSCKGLSADDTACHEFPYRSTSQGGNDRAASVWTRPFLKIINESRHNRPQGTKLSQFYGACGLYSAQSAGSSTRFIVTPNLVLPTLQLCNN